MSNGTPTVNIHEPSAGNEPAADAPTNAAPAAPAPSVSMATAKTQKFTAPDGRVITTRWLSPFERMKLFRALGSELSSNEAYMSYAMICATVASIDGDPCPMPANRGEFEAMATRLGDDLFEVLQDKTVEMVGRINEAKAGAADRAKN